MSSSKNTATPTLGGFVSAKDLFLNGKKNALAAGPVVKTKAEIAIARKKLELQQAIEKAALEDKIAGANSSNKSGDTPVSSGVRLPAPGEPVEPPFTRAEALGLMKMLEEVYMMVEVTQARVKHCEKMLEVNERDSDDEEDNESDDEGEEPSGGEEDPGNDQLFFDEEDVLAVPKAPSKKSATKKRSNPDGPILVSSEDESAYRTPSKKRKE